MEQLTTQIKNIVLGQLNQDGLSANGFIKSYSGSVTNQQMEIVKLELLFFNHLSVVIQATKNSRGEMCIHLVGLSGIIETDDLINISNSLNSVKDNLASYF